MSRHGVCIIDELKLNFIMNTLPELINIFKNLDGQINVLNKIDILNYFHEIQEEKEDWLKFSNDLTISTGLMNKNNIVKQSKKLLKSLSTKLHKIIDHAISRSESPLYETLEHLKHKVSENTEKIMTDIYDKLEQNMGKIEKMIKYEFDSIERFIECMNEIDFDNDQNFKRLVQVLRIMCEKMNHTNMMSASYRGIQNIKNNNTIRKKILASRIIDGFD